MGAVRVIIPGPAHCDRPYWRNQSGGAAVPDSTAGNPQTCQLSASVQWARTPDDRGQRSRVFECHVIAWSK